MANTIDDLRSHLFETLAALRDKDTPMELDRARTVAEVAKVLIDSAKVEVDFLKVTGATRSTGFLPEGEKPPAPAPPRLSEARTPADAVLHEAVISGPVAERKTAPGIGSDRCVLCGCQLTTSYLIDQKLCGSCSDRPEGQRLKALRKRA